MSRAIWWKFALMGGLALASLLPVGAHAAMYRVLYAFAGNVDGENPAGGLIGDSAGNLYGTTTFGGTGSACFGGGCGTVYKLTPDGTKTTLYSFLGGASDGRSPIGKLALDAGGNLYGATEFGGGTGCQDMGCGTVFKLAPNGTQTILHAFADDGTDGVEPAAGVVLDKSGNVYGTAYGGGVHAAGIVFKIAPNNTETILHTFGDTGDGYNPDSLVRDKQGNLIGTTDAADTCTSSCGTVFKLTRDGDYAILHTFNPGSDGAAPEGGLIFDGSGNMYGATRYGGTVDCDGIYGCGTVFKLTQAGVESVLYSFTTGDDGRFPQGGLVFDNSGNLLGTTRYGGGNGCHGPGCGTVFMLAPDGTETVLHVLIRNKGAHPLGNLVKDHRGNFYGTASTGGSTTEFGAVFKVRH